MQLRTNVWKMVSLTLLVPAMTFVAVTQGAAQDTLRPVQPEMSVPGTSGDGSDQQRTGPRSPTPDDRPGANRAEPETRLQPRYDPPGGCRYRDRTLELIV